MPSISVVLMFLGSVLGQLFGLSLLPLTKGFTQPLPTLLSIAGFALGVGFIARLSHSGVNLSVMIPLMSTLIPLCTVGIGVLGYGEAASLPKLAMLVTACLLIGTASTV